MFHLALVAYSVPRSVGWYIRKQKGVKATPLGVGEHKADDRRFVISASGKLRCHPAMVLAVLFVFPYNEKSATKRISVLASGRPEKLHRDLASFAGTIC
jgi:hypothetical protein